MDTSILVARILAIAYLSFALGLIFNRDFYRKEIPKLIENAALLIYGGFMAVVFGCLIIHYHNTWNADWTTIVTVIGWLGLVKGIVLLAFPKSYTLYKDVLFHEDRLLKTLLPLTLIIGLMLAYFGFVH